MDTLTPQTAAVMENCIVVSVTTAFHRDTPMLYLASHPTVTVPGMRLDAENDVDARYGVGESFQEDWDAARTHVETVCAGDADVDMLEEILTQLESQGWLLRQIPCANVSTS